MVRQQVKLNLPAARTTGRAVVFPPRAGEVPAKETLAAQRKRAGIRFHTRQANPNTPAGKRRLAQQKARPRGFGRAGQRARHRERFGFHPIIPARAVKRLAVHLIVMRSGLSPGTSPRRSRQPGAGWRPAFQSPPFARAPQSSIFRCSQAHFTAIGHLYLAHRAAMRYNGMQASDASFTEPPLPDSLPGAIGAVFSLHGYRRLW